MSRPAAARKRPATALRQPAAASNPAGAQPAGSTAGRTEPDGPTGPFESGSSARQGRAKRQYTWWITFSYPYPETVARLNLRTPDEFDHQTFQDLILDIHQAANIAPVEMVVFKEKHQRTNAAGERLIHWNSLVRYDDQHAWTVLGRKCMDQRIRVDFAEHVKTWYDGVVYGRIKSMHKPQDDIDPSPRQWAASGRPTPFTEVLPAKWHKQGRQPKFSPLQAYDVMVKNEVRSEAQAWMLAKKQDREGDRALLAFLLEHRGVASFIEKIVTAVTCDENARRVRVGRIGLLQEVIDKGTCTCAEPCLWLKLAREVLQSNGIQGLFQQAIYEALANGRGKMMNVFLIGPTNAGKTFLIMPLKSLYRVYEPPDSGSYPLEEILGKEVILLNDFTWDEAWLKWPYLKRLLEGGSIPVARPKNRGSNVEFNLDSPVIGTACCTIQLFVRDGRRLIVDQAETSQMNSRVRYLYLNQSISATRKCAECAHCAARLYMEGGSAVWPRTRSRTPPRT